MTITTPQIPREGRQTGLVRGPHRPVNVESELMMKQSVILAIVLTLMMQCATLKPALADPPSDPEVTVPTSLLRRATARLDSLELALRFAENQATEQDSLRVGEREYWQTQLAVANATAESWRREATSWWRRNVSAFWVAVGVGLAALALN